MKKIAIFAALSVTLLGGVAYAAAIWGRFDIWTQEVKASKLRPLVINTPLFVGPHLGATPVIARAANSVTRILGGSYTIDFATATITCEDSAAQTLPGARVGDTCTVGPPAAAAANTSFTCRVSAANQVIIRYCAAGTAADPASAAYAVTVISQQP